MNLYTTILSDVGWTLVFFLGVAVAVLVLAAIVGLVMLMLDVPGRDVRDFILRWWNRRRVARAKQKVKSLKSKVEKCATCQVRRGMGLDENCEKHGDVPGQVEDLETFIDRHARTKPEPPPGRELCNHCNGLGHIEHGRSYRY